jgi:hypothetical protein
MSDNGMTGGQEEESIALQAAKQLWGTTILINVS